MSEARRQRQQEREGIVPDSGKRRTVLMYAGFALLLACAYLAGWYHRNHKYDNFAKCLANKGAKMYGLYWCPHCQEQKEMFGKAFEYVPYEECAIEHSSELAPRCKIAGVKLFPSWQFGAEPPKEGVLSLDALSDKTGCALP